MTFSAPAVKSGVFLNIQTDFLFVVFHFSVFNDEFDSYSDAHWPCVAVCLHSRLGCWCSMCGSALHTLAGPQSTGSGSGRRVIQVFRVYRLYLHLSHSPPGPNNKPPSHLLTAIKPITEKIDLCITTCCRMLLWWKTTGCLDICF